MPMDYNTTPWGKGGGEGCHVAELLCRGRSIQQTNQPPDTHLPAFRHCKPVDEGQAWILPAT
jgi:hypothetical protein